MCCAGSGDGLVMIQDFGFLLLVRVKAVGAMVMAVGVVVIDAQCARAIWEHAFSVFSGSFHHFTHSYSYR